MPVKRRISINTKEQYQLHCIHVRIIREPGINYLCIRFKLVFISLLVLFSMICSYELSEAKIYKYRQNGVWCYTDDVKRVPEGITEVYEGDYGNWQPLQKEKPRNSDVDSYRNRPIPSDISPKPQQKDTLIIPKQNSESIGVTGPGTLVYKGHDSSSMLGIILLLLGSIVRGWGLLSRRRGPVEAAPVASGPVLAIFSIVSTVMGLIGAVLIGADTSFWFGIIAFAVFWFLSGIWAPILTALGL